MLHSVEEKRSELEGTLGATTAELASDLMTWLEKANANLKKMEAQYVDISNATESFLNGMHAASKDLTVEERVKKVIHRMRNYHKATYVAQQMQIKRQMKKIEDSVPPKINTLKVALWNIVELRNGLASMCVRVHDTLGLQDHGVTLDSITRKWADEKVNVETLFNSWIDKTLEDLFERFTENLEIVFDQGGVDLETEASLYAIVSREVKELVRQRKGEEAASKMYAAKRAEKQQQQQQESSDESEEETEESTTRRSRERYRSAAGLKGRGKKSAEEPKTTEQPETTTPVKPTAVKPSGVKPSSSGLKSQEELVHEKKQKFVEDSRNLIKYPMKLIVAEHPAHVADFDENEFRNQNEIPKEKLCEELLITLSKKTSVKVIYAEKRDMKVEQPDGTTKIVKPTFSVPVKDNLLRKQPKGFAAEKPREWLCVECALEKKKKILKSETLLNFHVWDDHMDKLEELFESEETRASKPECCTYCGKIFPLAKDDSTEAAKCRKSHLPLQIGRSIMCILCLNKPKKPKLINFKSEAALRDHLNKVHAIKNYCCVVCDKDHNSTSAARSCRMVCIGKVVAEGGTADGTTKSGKKLRAWKCNTDQCGGRSFSTYAEKFEHFKKYHYRKMQRCYLPLIENYQKKKKPSGGAGGGKTGCDEDSSDDFLESGDDQASSYVSDDEASKSSKKTPSKGTKRKHSKGNSPAAKKKEKVSSSSGSATESDDLFDYS